MAFSIIIPSKNPDNLIACVRSIFENEPNLPRHKIIVVNDGAREKAEAELPGVTWIEGVKPFVYARNVNCGIRAAGDDDVILMNDDARLLTPWGFTALDGCTSLVGGHYGILSPGLTGSVGNLNQLHGLAPQFRLGVPVVRDEDRMLCFVCVHIRREVLSVIGNLCEEYTGYGFDDDHACYTARQAGYRLGIFDGCLVEHGVLPSTFRDEQYPTEGFYHNQRIFQEKWGGA